MTNVRRVLVVGQGYVGQAVGRAAAARGHVVTGFDTDATRAAEVDGIVPYRVVDDPDVVGDFDVAVIAVPTPLADRAPDIRHLREAAGTVGRGLRMGGLVVVESTVYPGATRAVVATALAEASGLRPGADFSLGYSPERIDPGPTSPELAEIPRVVSGIDEESLRRTQAFYDTIVDRTVPVARIEVAELSKLIENTFRHINIAFVNELALAEASLGVDVREALDAAGSKPYGFMKFTPGGGGVGGDCIPVSPAYLNWAVVNGGGAPLQFVELADNVDARASAHVVDHAEKLLSARGGSADGARVLLVGVAYKKNVAEVRGSAGLRIAALLRDRGFVVTAVDPLIPPAAWPDGIARAELTAGAIADTDLAVVLVAHDGVDLAPLLAAGIPVLDTNHMLHGATVVAC